MARTVGDVALAMSILAGPDDVDLYAPPVPVPDYAPLDVELSNLRVGWSTTAGVPVRPEVQRSVAEAAAALGEMPECGPSRWRFPRWRTGTPAPSPVSSTVWRRAATWGRS